MTISGEADKILTVEQWGDIQWKSMESAFHTCANLDVLAADSPNLSFVNNMSYMFGDCTSLVGTLAFNEWDVSAVTNMGSLFTRAPSFNQDISNWDVSSVTWMGDMFAEATSFNQNISNWDVFSVTVMGSMFRSATTF